MAATDTVLKILTGVQSGVDIVLAEGEYALGSGNDDDIQIFDVSLAPAHVHIAIRQGKIEVAGGKGSLKTGNGLALEAGSDFQEIEPLDIVSVGTSRFALGATTANWPSIVNVGGLSQSPSPVTRKSSSLDEFTKLLSSPGRRTFLVAAVLLLTMAIFTMSYGFGLEKSSEAQIATTTDLEHVDASLSKFPFAKRLATRQEIDGTVFVTGYVSTPVERRAALTAIRDAGIPAKVRISVTELIRNEISNFLDSEDAKLTFNLSDTGVLTLDGVMLDSVRLDQMIEKMRDRVMGVASITSNVRTGSSLLRDVQALAGRSQILPLVLLRRDGDLIEASGVIPTDKIDAWAGFLQAYSTQLASTIPLRSLVFLQDPSKPNVKPDSGNDKALYLGPSTAQGNDVSVDVNRLKAGSFNLSDIFVGQPRQPPDGDAPASPLSDLVAEIAPAEGRPTDGSADASIIDLNAILGAGRSVGPDAGGDAVPASTPPLSGLAEGSSTVGSANAGGIDRSPVPGSGRSPKAPVRIVGTPLVTTADDVPPWPTEDELGIMGKRLIENWDNNTLDDSENAAALKNGIKALEETRIGGEGQASLPVRYGRMLASLRGNDTGGRSCWYGSQLNQNNVLGTLFWLDLLSVTDQLSLSRLSPQFQELLIEAALNPDMTGRCAAPADGTHLSSVYLYEVSRNPEFIRHILRDTQPYELDVSGVNLAGERYIQTRAGVKFRQGAAPDEGSRILTVGELGLVLERRSGYASVIFDNSLNWFLQ